MLKRKTKNCRESFLSNQKICPSVSQQISQNFKKPWPEFKWQITKPVQLPACSRGALLLLSRSASELTRAQGRAQEVLPGHPETPECHLNTLKGRRTTKTECHCVSLQESNNKRQRLKNSNFLKFHNHQFATKLRSNTWTSKYAELSLWHMVTDEYSGFSRKRLLHDEY